MASRNLLIGLVAFAGLSFYCAWSELADPSRPPFTGRTAWLHSIAFSMFGPEGATYIYLGFGVALLGLALANWFKSRVAR